MKIVRYDGGRIGLLQDDLVYDASEFLGDDPAAWPPTGVVQLIAKFDALKPGLEKLLKGTGKPLASVRLDAPLVWPHKLLAYPVNYLAHGHEMNSKNRANINGFFMKSNSSISGPNDPIVLPDVPSREIHHECELGLIIGKRGRHIELADAMDYVFGYCCLIDCTVRGNEERVMRKSYDTFTPIGPAIVTKDEVLDYTNIGMKLWVNDVLKQDANTRDLLVDIPNMITIASSVLTLEPGDLFATGTPAGVGPIKAGDKVRIEIEGVGKMEIPVIQGEGGYNIAIKKEEVK
jgi:2-keto-4-pentenoate hydratase/2-oxohepta-3-ene-1,7-dioic acid hydratase in catechol pathway